MNIGPKYIFNLLWDKYRLSEDNNEDELETGYYQFVTTHCSEYSQQKKVPVGVPAFN